MSIEFLDSATGELVAKCNATIIPHLGSIITVQDVSWRVQSVSYALETTSTEGSADEQSVCAFVWMTKHVF